MANPWLRLSAANLALAYVVASLLMLALFATPLWFAWRSSIDARRIEVLRDDQRRLADVFEAEGPAALAGVLERRVARGHREDSFYVFADPSGRRLAGNLGEWPASVPEQPGRYRVKVTSNGAWRQAFVIYTRLPGGYRLLVGGDNTPYRRMEELFAWGIAASSGGTLLLGVLAAWAIRRELLARVQRVGQTASAIVAGDLSRRLPIGDGGEELDLLAQTVNRMLDQIEKLIGGVRNVSNAIAHDLRTPLAELRTRLEELAMSRLSREEATAELEAAVADVDRVIAIFNSLLRLAEIDSGVRRAGFKRTDLASVARDAIEFYEPVAEERRIALEARLGEELFVSGDPVLIAQAIANLLDNAIKYAPEASRIVVEGVRRTDTVELTVADAGPGIPESERAKVVERFYRGDASRGASPGVGLGLPLVAAAARLHGGMLRLADNQPGLRASLLFPPADPAH